MPRIPRLSGEAHRRRMRELRCSGCQPTIHTMPNGDRVVLTKKGCKVKTKCREKRSSNPKRPPKTWWRDCVEGVEDSGSADDPQSVCGSLWYHKMTKTQRRTATRKRERKRNPNPWDSFGWR